jgi:hypothetical protein
MQTYWKKFVYRQAGKDSTCRQADRSVYLKIGGRKIYLLTGKLKLVYEDR